jgi:uncharacterized protein (TIGR02757 family)
MIGCVEKAKTPLPAPCFAYFCRVRIPPPLQALLHQKATQYNQTSFIAADPISIPHLFTKKQDIEIAGFMAAIFSWGNRTTIINKSTDLMQLMHMQPYDFVLHHQPRDLQKLETFKHRTFNADDLLYFLDFFKRHYQQYGSLETAFSLWLQPGDATIENALIGFRNYFFDAEHLKRTEKHISSPATHSACKRINMFLRWMVRTDKAGVDFGLWKKIKPAQLICPLDVHVARVARNLGLLQRKQTDWQAALELTHTLQQLDRKDPVKYDFALFGWGVMEKF